MQITLLILAIALLIPILGKFFFWIYPLELLTNFQVNYFWLTIALLILCAILWRQGQLPSRWPLFLLLFSLTVNGVDLGTWYWPSSRQTGKRPDSLTVMSYNINVQNTAIDEILQSIQSINPTVVLIVELDTPIAQQLVTRTQATYPHYFRSPGGGFGIFSKLPLSDSSGQKFPGSTATNLVTHLEYGGRRIQIIGTHPFVPVKSSTFEQRNLHLQALGNYLADRQEPTILMGDFNLTPWSPYYRQFIHKIQLHNTRYGFGIIPTWIRAATHVKYPSFLLPFLQIPIDHIFVSKEFQVMNTRSGDSGNSDHTPIIAELAVS
jgi:endonuclease/exonuclease/phosphatase (EEP) superfamily protein YafD